MNPTAIIREAAVDGVRLILSPAGTIKASGDQTAVNRWLSVIREHKAAIMEALKVGAGDTAAIWHVTYQDGSKAAVHCSPAATLSEILENRPGATAEPLVIPESACHE